MKYLSALCACALFDGIEEEELQALLGCLSATVVRYERGRMIFCSGERLERFGVVLAGQVQVFQDDYYGKRSILVQMGTGSLVGESFACAQTEALPISVAATADTDLLLIDYRRLVRPCAKACDFHGRLIQNMLGIVASKNVSLTQKIEFASRRTTREKLLAYLSVEAQRVGNSHFYIPFNRQELADYLFVERSALSAELSRLRRDGVLDFNKNEFTLHPAR